MNQPLPSEFSEGGYYATIGDGWKGEDRAKLKYGDAII